MKKNLLFIIIILLSCNILIAQKLSFQTNDSINGRPIWKSYIYFKLKLNGIYDINGGLQNEETFNLNKIDVWGDDDTPNFRMDMHQSQIRLLGSHELGNHQIIGYFEGDFWGGNNKMRLRMAYLQYHFFQFGQDWSFFGDKDIWPNVFDWDGPSSGIWRRDPFLRFFFTTQSNWQFDFGLEAPGAQINFVSDNNYSFSNSSGNPLPDFISAVKKKTSWGHLRLSGILRYLPYERNMELNYITAFGASLSGYIKTGKKFPNPIQFQFVSGKGIATYVVSFDGANYDAVNDGYGNMHAVPVSGGWVSYELWINRVFHINFVGGLTNFETPKIKELEITDGGFKLNDGDIKLDYFYALVNIMADPFENFTVGIEYNYGKRGNYYHNIEYPLITPLYGENTLTKTRAANRISFGVFYNF
jgi:hypothetical protein